MRNSITGHQIRTTVYLDENLYLEAKKKAIEDRTTLTSLIQIGLKDQIIKRFSSKKRKKYLMLGSYNLGLGNSNKTFRRVDIYDDSNF